MLLGCASAVTAHLAVLYTGGADPLSTPVGALSLGVDGTLHGLGLSLFAMAQVALAFLIGRPAAGWPTRAAQGLLVADALLTVHLAHRFASVPAEVQRGLFAVDSLALLASGTGLIMSFAAPGLFRRRRQAGLWNIACLALWIALMPLALLVDESWLGAYERLVGTVFVAWMVGLAVLLGFMAPPPAR